MNEIHKTRKTKKNVIKFNQFIIKKNIFDFIKLKIKI